jgi:hypothetical protein
MTKKPKVKSRTYKKKNGRVKGNATAIGRELRRIGKAKPASVDRAIVEAAREPSNPMHANFTWNVKKAAWKCWLDEARFLRNHIVEVERYEHQPEREFVHPVLMSLPARDRIEGLTPSQAHSRNVPRSGYLFGDAMSDEPVRQFTLIEALDQLEALQNRFGHLKELAAVFKAVDNVRAKVATKKKKK